MLVKRAQDKEDQKRKKAVFDDRNLEREVRKRVVIESKIEAKEESVRQIKIVKQEEIE